MKKIYYFIFLGIFLWACKDTNSHQQKNDVPNNSPKIDTISYELKHISKEMGNCGDDAVKCAKASMQYVVFDAKEKENLQQVNALIEENLKGNAPTMEASLDSFLLEAQTFFKENPDASTGYDMEVEQKVIYNTPQLLTVEDFTYLYTGGAHGIHGTVFYNIDIQNGRFLELSDVLVEGYETSLKNIAETVFRDKYLEEGMEKYSDAGFFLDDNEFVLTDNFALTKQGIKLVYNPYEIAPYAMGQQEFIIPYTALKKLIRSQGLLQQFLR